MNHLSIESICVAALEQKQANGNRAPPFPWKPFTNPLVITPLPPPPPPSPSPSQSMTDSDIALWRQIQGLLYSYNVMAAFNGILFFFLLFKKKRNKKKIYKQEGR